MDLISFIVRSAPLGLYQLHHSAGHANRVCIPPASLPDDGQKIPIKILSWFPAPVDGLSDCDTIDLVLPPFRYK